MAAWGYEFNLLVLKYLSRVSEDKIHISARPCNILYVYPAPIVHTLEFYPEDNGTIVSRNLYTLDSDLFQRLNNPGPFG